jgi:acyl carrier protein
MSNTSTIAQVKAVFEDLFEGTESVAFGPAITANDVEGWDSVQNVMFIVALEARFGIKFTVAETEELQSIGSFVSLIERKLAKKN